MLYELAWEGDDEKGQTASSWLDMSQTEKGTLFFSKNYIQSLK